MQLTLLIKSTIFLQVKWSDSALMLVSAQWLVYLQESLSSQQYWNPSKRNKFANRYQIPFSDKQTAVFCNISDRANCRLHTYMNTIISVKKFQQKNDIDATWHRNMTAIRHDKPVRVGNIFGREMLKPEHLISDGVYNWRRTWANVQWGDSDKMVQYIRQLVPRLITADHIVQHTS